MRPVELSERADADIEAILDCGVAQFGAKTGEAYVAGFEASFALIAEHPLAGAVHDEVRPPIRSLPHGSHRIFYDVIDDRVIVQRILHKAMDVERHL